jgi:hypothetical protein
MVFWIPIAMLLLHRIIAGRRLRDGLAFGLTVAAQVLSGVYGALYFIISLIVFFPALIVAAGARQLGKLFAPLAIAALAAAAIGLPYSRPYSEAATVAGPRPAHEIRHFGASAASYVAATPSNRLHGWTSRFGGEELNLFPGLAAIALGAIGVASAASSRSRIPLAYVALLVFAADASRGLSGFTFPLLFRYVPPMQAMRVPSRFALIVNLAIGMLAAVGLAAVLRNRSLRTRTVAGVIVAGVLLVEYAARPALANAPRPSLADRWLAGQPHGVLVELPLPRPEAMWPSHESRFMFEGMVHWLPMANGYSGFFPASYLELVQIMRTFPDERSLAYLRRRKVHYVLLRENFYDANRWRDLCERVDRARDVKLLAGFPPPGNERIYTITE